MKNKKAKRCFAVQVPNTGSGLVKLSGDERYKTKSQGISAACKIGGSDNWPYLYARGWRVIRADVLMPNAKLSGGATVEKGSNAGQTN